MLRSCEVGSQAGFAGGAESRVGFASQVFELQLLFGRCEDGSWAASDSLEILMDVKAMGTMM